jgi:FkbM family methyltransferase
VNALASFGRRLQFFEALVPYRVRLPLRYHFQRIARALEPEMRVLPDLVEPGGIALDIGANRGVYAYALASRGAVVHCFDPLRECCEYIRAARLERVTVHDCALSDAAGTLRLYIPTVGDTPIWTRASLQRPDGAFRMVEVEVRTLDSFRFAGVNFMKIDVEGAEAAVLRGADATLQREHPCLLIEIDRARHSRASCDELIGWLRARAYEPHVLEGDRLRRSHDLWLEARGHFNFIFTRAR